MQHSSIAIDSLLNPVENEYTSTHYRTGADYLTQKLPVKKNSMSLLKRPVNGDSLRNLPALDTDSIKGTKNRDIFANQLKGMDAKKRIA